MAAVARACAVLAGIFTAVAVPGLPASASASGSWWCVQSHSPWRGWLTPAFRGRGLGGEIFAAIAQFGHNHLAIASGWRFLRRRRGEQLGVRWELRRQILGRPCPVVTARGRPRARASGERVAFCGQGAR